MNFFAKSFTFASLFCAINLLALPKMILRNVKNSTPFNLSLTKQNSWVNQKPRLLPTGQTACLNMTIMNGKNIPVFGELFEAMVNNAAYVIKKTDSNGNMITEQKVFFNICMTPGGINDGSGLIVGKLGSNILKLLMCDTAGRHSFSTKTLKNNQASSLYLDIEFYVNENDQNIPAEDYCPIYARYEIVEQ